MASRSVSHVMWFDLETTGLDIHTLRVMEMAAVLCTIDEPLTPVAADQWVFRLDVDVYSELLKDSFVVGMHNDTGLVGDSMRSEIPATEAGNLLNEFMNCAAPDVERARLGGTGVSTFDLQVLRNGRDFQRFNVGDRLDHGCVDMGCARRNLDTAGHSLSWAHKPSPQIVAEIQATTVGDMESGRNLTHRAMWDVAIGMTNFRMYSESLAP